MVSKWLHTNEISNFLILQIATVNKKKHGWPSCHLNAISNTIYLVSNWWCQNVCTRTRKLYDHNLQIYDKITSDWVVAQSVHHKQNIFKIIFYKIMITGTLKEIFVTTILNNITYIVIVLPEYIVHWKKFAPEKEQELPSHKWGRKIGESASWAPGQCDKIWSQLAGVSQSTAVKQ